MLKLLAVLWFIVFVLLFSAADLAAPDSKLESDYHTSFYIAGLLVEKGKCQQLYPAAGAGSFINQPFDKLTHEILPSFGKDEVGVFMYSPLVALFFSTLALLPANLGLLVFQAGSVISLTFSCSLFARSREGGKNFFFESFAFMPLIATIWIGQLGLIFGLLPLSAGYYLLNKKRAFAAGLALSGLFLKPQLLPLAVLICLFSDLIGVSVKKSRCLLGLIAGCLFLLAGSLCCGFEVLQNWISSLFISESILSSTLYKSRDYLIAGLPGAVFSLCPDKLRSSIKLFVYVAGFLVATALFFQGRQAVLQEEKLENKIDKLFVLSILSLPVFSPRLLLYDLCIFILPFMISQRMAGSLPLLMRTFLFAINGYVIAAILAGNSISPLFLSFILLAGAFAIATYAGRTKIKD